MTMKVRISHLEQSPPGRLFASVVTVGDAGTETRFLKPLEAGEDTTIDIEAGQFLLIDETEPKEV